MTATLTQLRTGHCGLKAYLHRFKIEDCTTYDCGEGDETVQHYLLYCKTYIKERKKLHIGVGFGKMKMHILLNGRKEIRHTLAFIKETRRFKY